MFAKRHGRQPPAFLGTGWSFPPVFRKTATGAGVETVSDEEDVAQSLEILFGTALGERFLQPTYGLDLRELLFEALNTSLKTELEERIRTAVLVHEPRVDMVALRISDSPDGELRIELDYRVRATNSRFNLVFPFYRGDANELRGGLGRRRAMRRAIARAGG